MDRGVCDCLEDWDLSQYIDYDNECGWGKSCSRDEGAFYWYLFKLTFVNFCLLISF